MKFNVKHSLEIIYLDIWGQSSYPSTEGHKYYLTFIDAYSLYTWLYPLKQKSQVQSQHWESIKQENKGIPQLHR